MQCGDGDVSFLEAEAIIAFDGKLILVIIDCASFIVLLIIINSPFLFIIKIVGGLCVIFHDSNRVPKVLSTVLTEIIFVG